MENQPLRIDLQEIINTRMPRSKRRWIPRFIVSRLEKIVCQDRLNEILHNTFPHTGTTFASAALKELDITVNVEGEENIPDDGRFIFASNHPLGGLDGIALISVLGQRYGDDNLRFPVNDVLMNVRPLTNIFIPINKFGGQGRRATQLINDTYDSDKQIIFFPAGLVSRRRKGVIADLTWQKAFVAKAIKSKRDIIPIYFEGQNSSRFYNMARLRQRLGLKFNFEQILLPSELCRAQGKTFTIRFGTPRKYTDLIESGLTPIQIAAEIRDYVYTLAQKP